jgi:cell division septation protein DedD
MSDINEQRRFDWGPPVQTGDGLKEWIIYIVIIAVLGAGIWLLLDINGQKKFTKAAKKDEVIVAVDQKLETFVPKEYEEAPSIEQEKTVVAVAATNTDSTPAPKVKTLKNMFYVQIGAFTDEASANEIFGLLKKESIEAILLKPDEQFEIYRLVVGPYETEKIAEDKAEQLNEIGFPCFVVEAQ